MVESLRSVVDLYVELGAMSIILGAAVERYSDLEGVNV